MNRLVKLDSAHWFENELKLLGVFAKSANLGCILFINKVYSVVLQT